MATRRSRPWYVGSDSLSLSGISSLALSFLVVNSLLFSTKHPSHDQWWYWPLLIGTIGLASLSIASTLWLIRDRLRAKRAGAPQ